MKITLLSFDNKTITIRLFLGAVLNQFYWNGNIRMARLMANGIMIHAAYGVFNNSTKHIPEFNTLMIEFYETRRQTIL